MDNWGRYPSELKSRASRDRLHPPVRFGSGKKKEKRAGEKEKEPLFKRVRKEGAPGRRGWWLEPRVCEELRGLGARASVMERRPAWVTAGAGCDVRAASRMRWGRTRGPWLFAGSVPSPHHRTPHPLMVTSCSQPASFLNTACSITGMCNLSLTRTALRKAFLTFNLFNKNIQSSPHPV